MPLKIWSPNLLTPGNLIKLLNEDQSWFSRAPDPGGQALERPFDLWHEIEATLNGLSHGQNIQIIRAFSYFSQLANIAEDRRALWLLQTRTLIGLKPGIKTIAAVHSQCRRWINSTHYRAAALLPLHLNQQTYTKTIMAAT
jgi:hypothetical protein